MDDGGIGGPEVTVDSVTVVCNELILWIQIRWTQKTWWILLYYNPPKNHHRWNL